MLHAKLARSYYQKVDMKFKKIDIGKSISSQIVELLVGGSSDPGCYELESAAMLFVTLKNLDLPFSSEIMNEECVVCELREANIFDRDFLKAYLED